MLPTPKALIFDLGNVIIPFDFQRAYDQLEPLCGHSAAEIRRRAVSSGLAPMLEAGQINSGDFVSRMGETLGAALDFEQFRDIWNSVFFPETLLPESLIAGLKRRNLLVLLSNTNDMHFSMLERKYPILGHFERRALSHVVGACKPSPLIYQKAVELAGCRAEECFFTDDIAEYVQAARNLGIDAVQFRSAKQLQEELVLRGLRWD